MEHNVNVEVNSDQAERGIHKIKSHFQQNKQAYIAGGSGVLVGAVSVLFLKRPGVSIAPVMNNVQNNIVVQALGDPGNVVQCAETGTIYASQGQAARELGVAASHVSQHLNNLRESVNGLHLEILGKAGQPLA